MQKSTQASVLMNQIVHIKYLRRSMHAFYEAFNLLVMEEAPSVSQVFSIFRADYPQETRHMPNGFIVPQSRYIDLKSKGSSLVIG